MTFTAPAKLDYDWLLLYRENESLYTMLRRNRASLYNIQGFESPSPYLVRRIEGNLIQLRIKDVRDGFGLNHNPLARLYSIYSPFWSVSDDGEYTGAGNETGTTGVGPVPLKNPLDQRFWTRLNAVPRRPTRGNKETRA
jgi:hypothetical protein